MEVILLEKHAKLGGLGNVVRVKNGYARNFLIPQKKAIRATKENKEIFEARKATIQQEVDEKTSVAAAQREKLVGKHINIITQASDDGKLYGSVNPGTIVSTLNETFGLELAKANILMDDQIKFTGEYRVKVAFYVDVVAEIKVIVARSEEEAEAILSRKIVRESRASGKEERIAEINAEEAKQSLEIAEEEFQGGEYIEATEGGVQDEEYLEATVEEVKVEEEKPVKKSTRKKTSS